MRITRFLALFSILFFAHVAVSQTVYEWYQDGKVIFQTKINASVKIPLADKDNANVVDIKQVPFIAELKEKYKITRLVHLHPELINDEKLVRTYQIEFEDIRKIEYLISEIGRHSFIEYAEKKELHKTCLTPNDLGPVSGTGNQWGLWKINAQQAWDISTGSANIVVAVTDNAINNHPDLVNKLVLGRDVVDNDNDPSGCGTNTGLHGTHVAGIVGAQTNNGMGVASIGWNVSVMPVKIGDCNGTLVAGYAGIIWAANNGADVINMSWGGAGYSTYGQNTCNNAAAQGAILIAAAGNSGQDGNPVFYPAAYNNVIAVANTQSNDTKAPSSEYGNWIDISAPGTSIRSCNATTGYTSLTGTSMASPMVAGLVGLMKSHAPSLTNAQLINCLLSSADNIDAQNPSYIGQLGSGRINAYQAMICVTAASVDRDAAISAINSPAGTTCSSTISPIVQLSNYGSNTLTSVTINYQVDNGTVQTFYWTGTLTTGQNTAVSLPSMTVANGGHTFTAYTSNPNNLPDQNPSNDQSTISFATFVTGIPLPFVETFEANSTSVGLWNVDNPDNGVTWQLANTSGTTPGTTSAGINFFYYNTLGQRDGLISPPLDFSGFATAEMYFEHAYRRYDQNSTDSLIIYISTDCGQSYTRVWARGENGTGTLATVATSTVNFIPQSSDDWCTGPVGASCFTINLNPYVGQSNVTVKFESYNNYGNNLYVDNINITGTPAPNNPPTASFTSSTTSICAGQTVTYTDQSTANITAWNWSFPGGTPTSSTQQNPTVTYNNSGTYNVSLQVTNADGTNTNTQNNYITVNALPNVVASANSTNICEGESVDLTASGANTYSWNNGLGAGATHTVSPTTNTTYTVTGTGTGGCTNTAQVSVTVNPLPVTPVISQTGNTLTVNAPGGSSIQWYYQGNPVPNGNTATITMIGDGSYTVVITNGAGCEASSSGEYSAPTSINELNGMTYKIYPVPTHGMFTLELSQITGALTVRLTDILGKELAVHYFSQPTSEQLLQFNLSDKTTGVYFLILELEHARVTEKVILAR